MLQRGVAAIDRQAKSEPQFTLQLGDHDAGQVGGSRVRHRFADAFEHARPLEYLARQRRRRGVIAGDQCQPAARVQTRNAGQKMQVVIDDRFRNRRAGDVGDMSARHPQQQQQAQHPLFVMVNTGDPGNDICIKGQARHDDDSPRRVVVVVDLSEGLHKARLQFAKPREFLRRGGCIGIQSVDHGAVPRSFSGWPSRPMRCIR